MGKEWLYWAGGGSSRSRKRDKTTEGGGERESTSPGCMCAVLQLFDFHQFPYPLNQHHSFEPDSSFLPEQPTPHKGLEAPRNSLELEEPFMEPPSLSSTLKHEEDLNIPMGIQIKTRRSRTDELLSSSECSSSSPSTKTPNLVARLMGLDLIPDRACIFSSSPSSNTCSSNPPSKKSQLHPRIQNLKQDFHTIDTDPTGGTRSLPETPRISSARRSDVDHHHHHHHHRLSLQINKENMGLKEEFEFSHRRRDLKLVDEIIRSPRHYAREVVKQVKEKVGRRVGLDITNTTIKNGDHDHVVLLKSKKPSKGFSRMGDELSPRLKSLESKNKPVQNQISSHSVSPKLSQSKSNKVSSKSKPQEQQQKQKSSTQKCKKGVGERFNPRLKKPLQTSDSIRTKQEEQFVRSLTKNRANKSDKKCKRTPLSILPIKKDPSPPATKLPQLQVSDSLSAKQSSTRLSSCSSHSYQQESTHNKLTSQENNKKEDDDDRFNGATTIADNGAEYHQYITRILNRTGIDKNTLMSFTNLYSLSHPLDPSIFHSLELSSTNSHIVTQRSNRKLIFQLLDEILGEIFKPHINLNPWIRIRHPISNDHQISGSNLIETVCEKIQSFPLADCRVLEDIDSLIDKDLCGSIQKQRFIEFEEEGEGIVSEIENHVLESLVEETAMAVFGVVERGGGCVLFVRTVTVSDGGHVGDSRDEMLFVGPRGPVSQSWGLCKEG